MGEGPLHRVRVVAALLVAVISVSDVAQDRPTHAGRIALFGTLHAHSELSGDVDASKGLTPQEAFEYARQHGLDFLGVSNHHKPTGAPCGAKFHLSAAEYQQSRERCHGREHATRALVRRDPRHRVGDRSDGEPHQHLRRRVASTGRD